MLCGASLWFYADQVDNLYQLLKSRQLQAAQALRLPASRVIMPASSLYFIQHIGSKDS